MLKHALTSCIQYTISDDICYPFYFSACRLKYNGLIGGVVAFRKVHFEQVNGFTNKFFGWGGEDDDMWQRQVYPP